MPTKFKGGQIVVFCKHCKPGKLCSGAHRDTIQFLLRLDHRTHTPPCIEFLSSPKPKKLGFRPSGPFSDMQAKLKKALGDLAKKPEGVMGRAMKRGGL